MHFVNDTNALFPSLSLPHSSRFHFDRPFSKDTAPTVCLPFDGIGSDIPAWHPALAGSHRGRRPSPLAFWYTRSSATYGSCRGCQLPAKSIDGRQWTSRPDRKMSNRKTPVSPKKRKGTRQFGTPWQGRDLGKAMNGLKRQYETKCGVHSAFQQSGRYIPQPSRQKATYREGQQRRPK